MLVHCRGCGLVFVLERQWVTVEDERARYAHHDNTAANEGYVKFLGQVAAVVEGLPEPEAPILDFGSGEHAVLTEMLRGRGLDCVAYDPRYGIGGDALHGRYDVVVLCEVIEHLRDLRAELARLAECLRPGGSIVVRTRCYPSVAELPAWWYARDPTHINFFAPAALAVAAALCDRVCQPTAEPDIFVWRPRG